MGLDGKHLEHHMLRVSFILFVDFHHDATEDDLLQTVDRLEAIAAELTANR